MGLSAGPLSRWTRCRPASRTSTAPTSRSTRRCLETWGWASPSAPTSSLTGRSPPARTSRISRRRGSATAVNASAVVAARAMHSIIYRYGNASSRAERRGAAQDRLRAAVDVRLRRAPVRDRDAHRRAALPARAAGPARALGLHGSGHRIRGAVVVAEAEEDLVEHDVVEDLDAVLARERRGEPLRQRAAALDEVGHAAAA